MSGYIGTQPVPQATQTRQTFTAAAGQTSFATSGYTPNYLDVWLNGVKLVNGTDFTATNGSDVVLTSGAADGDTLEVLAFTTFEVADINGGIDTHLNTSTATTDQTLSWNGTDYDWVDASAGATGGGSDKIFWENDQTVTTSYTITSGKNAGTFGPITIASGVTVTVGAGESWVII